MTKLIPIGRFAQITHLSVKALRIYADEGTTNWKSSILLWEPGSKSMGMSLPVHRAM